MNKGKQLRYEYWCESVQLWADKHGITIAQAVDILFFDDLEEPASRELYWAESSEFSNIFKFGNEK